MKRVHVLRGYPAQAQNSRGIGDAPAEEAIDHHTKAWPVRTSRAAGLSAILGTCGVWTATNFSGSQPVLRVSCSNYTAYGKGLEQRYHAPRDAGDQNALEQAMQRGRDIASQFSG